MTVNDWEMGKRVLDVIKHLKSRENGIENVKGRIFKIDTEDACIPIQIARDSYQFVCRVDRHRFDKFLADELKYVGWDIKDSEKVFEEIGK